MTFSLAGLSLFFLPIFAEETIEDVQTEKNDKEITPHYIHGLLIVGNEGDVESSPTCKGVQIKNIEIPGSHDELINRVHPLFHEKPFNEEVLTNIKQEIVKHYKKCNRPIVKVCVPEQDITEGTLQLVVIESKLGQVTCKGHRFSDPHRLTDYIQLSPGAAIASDLLLTDLAWINRNPFRRADVLFTPGLNEGTTDIELIMKERRPFRFFLGGDNTGNRATQNERLYGGFNWGNAFGFDHLLSYQQSYSPNCSGFASYTVDYVAPLRCRHILRVFGGYASVRPDLSRVDNRFRSRGRSSQASVRYDIPLELETCLHPDYQEIFFGFDYKNTNNNLIFLGDNQVPIIDRSVNISQFVLGYNYGNLIGRHKVTFNCDAYISPGRMLPDQSNQRYSELRQGARNSYVYARASINDIYQYEGCFSIWNFLRAQLASNILLPSEQYGLGGYNTIRGYDEREFNADNALIYNLELRSPPFEIYKSKYHDCEELIFLIFFDTAYGWNHFVPGEKQRLYLASIGPGLRYSIDSNVFARLDWGFALNRPRFNMNEEGLRNHRNKVHFGIVVSY